MVEKSPPSRPPSTLETIVAISTPPAQAGIGVVRISGPGAISIGRKLFKSSKAPLGSRIRHIEFGVILGEHGQEIDRGLAWAFAAPHSYSGEDTVEISCHGSLFILEEVVRAAITNGAVLAQPGEFTRRAFLNGKMDLLQAEGVVDLIRASGRFSLDNAHGLIKGQLSAQVTQISQTILHALAHLDALVDFPDDVTLDARIFQDSIAAALRQCYQLTSTFSTFSRRNDGCSIAVIGPPNVGKSSLFNFLLKESRAIVSPVPGTTRDLIEARLYIDGQLFRIIDSAGLHRSTDLVESEGIERAYRAAEDADLILLVFDSSRPWLAEYSELCKLLDPHKDLVVFNKADLPNNLILPGENSFDCLSLSALTGVGVDALFNRLRLIHSTNTQMQTAGITRLRHYDCLLNAQKHLEKAQTHSAYTRGAIECIAEDLQKALEQIYSLLGLKVDEEVLNLIFSEFCIGK